MPRIPWSLHVVDQLCPGLRATMWAASAGKSSGVLAFVTMRYPAISRIRERSRPVSLVVNLSTTAGVLLRGWVTPPRCRGDLPNIPTMRAALRCHGFWRPAGRGSGSLAEKFGSLLRTICPWCRRTRNGPVPQCRDEGDAAADSSIVATSDVISVWDELEQGIPFGEAVVFFSCPEGEYGVAAQSACFLVASLAEKLATSKWTASTIRGSNLCDPPAQMRIIVPISAWETYTYLQGQREV